MIFFVEKKVWSKFSPWDPYSPPSPLLIDCVDVGCIHEVSRGPTVKISTKKKFDHRKVFFDRKKKLVEIFTSGPILTSFVDFDRFFGF